VAITGDESGGVKLWNLVVGETTETIMEHHKASTCVTLSHSYLFSVSAFNDGIIQVYDNEIGEIISEFREHTAPIRHLHILEDNHKILSADEENHIKVWWANTGELIDSIHVPCQMLLSSLDGKYVVSGSGDNT
jgi:WD40 repeat protein